MSDHAVFVGGPIDGELRTVGRLTRWFEVPVRPPLPFLNTYGAEYACPEKTTFKTVRYGLEQYAVQGSGGLEIYAYVLEGVDKIDATWDVLGLTVARTDEELLPGWITNNRRRIAGKLWNLASQMMAAIEECQL